LPSGLVGWWRFNGDATDSSGNSNHGTFSGVEVYFDSPMGQALIFDGDDYVRVVGTSSLIGITSEITVEAWIKFSDTGDAFYVRTPFDLSPKAWGLDRYGGELRFYIYNGTTPIICKKAWTPVVNQWYHIAGTYDGETLKLYVDKDLVQSFEYHGNINSTNQGVVIGARHSDGGWGYLRGLLDDVRIWNVALSEGQLGFIYDFSDILPPIKADGSSVFKLGRTIPVKFELRDDQGDFVTDAVANIFVKKIANGTLGEIEVVSTAASTTGNLFRYDFSSNQYIFNLSTKLPLNNGVSWSTGTWEIRIELDDGMSYYVEIGLK
jgi:hypothetical protein